MPERRAMQRQTCERRPTDLKRRSHRKPSKNLTSSRVDTRANFPVSCSPKIRVAAQTKPQAHSSARFNHAIHSDQIRNLTLALDYAIAIGLTPNRFQTINLQQGGKSGAAAQTALQLFLKTVRDWISLNGERSAAIWVREVGPRVGEHVHILLHVPPRLQTDFNLKMRHWRRSIGLSRSAGLIKTVPLWQIHIEGDDRPSGVQNHHAVLSYMLKGHDRTSHRVNPNLRQQDCGIISGKRCGHTQNLGRTARLRNGWSV